MKLYKCFIVLGFISLCLSCHEDQEIYRNDLNLKEAPKDVLNKLNNNVTSKVDGGPCDGAVSIAFTVETNFDLKRPKYSCNRGFWFCTDIATYMQCLDNQGHVLYQIEVLTGDRVEPDNLYSINLVELDTDEIILSFPWTYFEYGDYTESDLEYFSVDERREILPGTYLIEGSYDVYKHDDKLIVLLPVEYENEE